MGLILKVASTAVGVWVAVWIVPGLSWEGEWWAFAALAFLIAIANAIVKPVLNFFSIPFILLTFGLFLFITNALILQIVVWLSQPERLNLGFASEGFWWATFFGAVVISLVRMILEKIFD